jgi:hypothetical protein
MPSMTILIPINTIHKHEDLAGYRQLPLPRTYSIKLKPTYYRTLQYLPESNATSEKMPPRCFFSGNKVREGLILVGVF